MMTTSIDRKFHVAAIARCGLTPKLVRDMIATPHDREANDIRAAYRTHDWSPYGDDVECDVCAHRVESLAAFWPCGSATRVSIIDWKDSSGDVVARTRHEYVRAVDDKRTIFEIIGVQ